MSRSKDYFMSDVRLPDEVRIGCVSFRGLSKLPLCAVYISIDDNEIGATFWGDTPEPWKGDSLVHVGMFRLPLAAATFQGEAERYRSLRAKRKVRLPDGATFEPGMLAIPDIPAAWRHEAISTTSRNLIHLYTAQGCAVLVRSFSKRGTMLDHPVLQPINENLRLHEDQWIGEFPEAQPLARTFEIQESPPGPEAAAEIDAAVARARESMGLVGQGDPALIIERLSAEIDQIRSHKRLSASRRKELAIDLGCLWGDALRAAKQWEWREVRPEPGRTVYAVCHPSRSHAVDPIAFVHRILSSKRVVNTSALLFNMIAEDDLPEAPPLTYSWLW